MGVGELSAEEAGTTRHGDPQVIFWRRVDVAGLERLELCDVAEGVEASSTVICAEDGGFRLDHRWRLSPDWSALSLEVERWGPDGHRRLAIERSASGWRVDGIPRPDLDGAEEPDLSVTPFCNSLAIRRIGGGAGMSLTLDTCYVDGADLTVARSRQRYDRLGPHRLRYVDLGLSAGFEADLEVDGRGLVRSYQHLFERVEPT